MISRHDSMRPDSGSTVVELLITMVIVSVAMTVAAILMLEAQKRSVLEMSRMMDPAISLALQRLKADITAAASSGGRYDDDPDEREPLLLALPTATIFYELVNGELRRTVGLNDPQPIIVGVKEFEWAHGWEPGSLRIDLAYEVGRVAGPTVENDQQVRQPRRVERRTLILKMRGGGGSASW